MNYSELTYKIAFSHLRSVTISAAREIISRFGSIEALFNADYHLLLSTLGSDKVIDRKKLDEALAKAVAEVQWVENNGVRALFFTDEDYPQRLLECEDAPLLVYTLGDANLNAKHIISVVGTRHSTAYGLSFVENFISEISSSLSDVLIVSGLAYGVDVAAHRESLKFNVPTLGVVAHGLSTVYPASHRDIAAKMVKSGGGLLTEYPHSTPVAKGYFLARNRIVAGICDALIVVETAEKGGSLITARLASAYGKPVFALPGRTTDIYSAGCNRLIFNNSASLFTNTKDFISAMMWENRKVEGVQQNLFVELPEQQKAIYDYLVNEGEATINQMACELNIPVSQLMQTVGDMEFDELLMSMPGSKYRISKKIR